jgi:hypothetical protein
MAFGLSGHGFLDLGSYRSILELGSIHKFDLDLKTLNIIYPMTK